MFAAIESLYKAGLKAKEFHAAHLAMEKEMMELGFPIAYSATNISVPFDVISDFFRGMRGSMLDMYRQPDKLLELMEVIFPIVLELGISGAEKNGVPRVYIPLHRGADGFMSLKQFETFYWPGLKKLTLALIEKGLTPCLFVEGDCKSRLEYFTEFPKGKVLALLDSTDIFRAKEVLGDTMPAGNMPPSLLSVRPSRSRIT
jgi:uroporphyrinogen-III decarboxylase